MLINFWVENFKCFFNEIEFSMEATKLKNLKENNTFAIHNISILKSSVIYGANASGKSSLLRAMKEMKKIIFSLSLSINKIYDDKDFFLLNSLAEDRDSKFEIEMIIDNILYRYGFTINKNYTIVKEWLFRKKLQPKAREVKLFIRDRGDINLGIQFKEGRGLFDKTRDNTLFLSVVAQFNGEISNKIINWFKNFNIINNIGSGNFENFRFRILDDDVLRDKVVNLIRRADVGIYDILKKKLSFDELKDKDPDVEKILPNFIIDPIKKKGIDTIETRHIKYNQNWEFMDFIDFDISLESDGTRKLLGLSGPILDTLINGKILVIDELDNSLHTELVKAIVKLFNSKKTNPNNAQLIFSTHDTNLLNQKLFRIDQIWFTQKNLYGECELYSLVEYKKIRNDLELEENYLNGRFGAVPHISRLL
jgi:AAA15 family ATPase/GTPase